MVQYKKIASSAPTPPLPTLSVITPIVVVANPTLTFTSITLPPLRIRNAASLPILMVAVFHGQLAAGQGLVDMPSALPCPIDKPQDIRRRMADSLTCQCDLELTCMVSFVLVFSFHPYWPKVRVGLKSPGDTSDFSCQTYAQTSSADESLITKCCSKDVVLDKNQQFWLTKPVPATFGDKNCVAAKPAQAT
ncbi:hypothetical protein MJO29_008043 [Puccinia striiformis f. sp. tritici]|nr:hypothetical protein MJO29_008043 [Puccinia striiformis f. sp. tritici]